MTLVTERIRAIARRQFIQKRRRGAAFWLLLISLVLFLLRWAPAIGRHIGLWPWIALLSGIVAGLPAFFRWIRWRLLWKLRNRLFVTYALIGLTPVVLTGILGAIAAYVLFGQFANFAATAEIHSELVGLAANTDSLARHFQQELADKRNLRRNSEAISLPVAVSPEATSIINISELQVGIYLDGKLQKLDLPPGHDLTTVPIPPAWAKGNFRGLVLDRRDHVYLRAVTRERVGPDTISVVTSLPLDAQVLARVVSGLGRMTLLTKVQIAGDILKADRQPADKVYRTKLAGPNNNHLKLGQSTDAIGTPSDLGAVVGGVLLGRANFLDFPLNFPTTLDTVQWSTGDHIAVIALVTSRPSLLYQRLFRESLLIGGGIRTTLILTAIVFAFLELLAIFLASRLSRTITQSVSDLYHATREVDQGRFNYRIPVSRQDQLAALSRSFNAMSESLVRLLEEQKEKERLEGELKIAQEVQSNLFPSCDVRLDGLELHGLCRPARTVSGDYYDFLVLGNRALCMAIGDISGKGISAALLMAGLHSAVRAFSLGGNEMATGNPLKSADSLPPDGAAAEIFQSPAHLMRLLNLHLYRSTQPEKYATLFLANYEVSTCTLRYSNGGQLPPLVLRADGSLVRLDRGGTVVGLLDDMRYDEGAITLHSGDLLIAYSDGVTEPENEFGDFGEARLVELVRRNRHLPLPEISDHVIEALRDWIGAEEQPDDITIVLARQN